MAHMGAALLGECRMHDKGVEPRAERPGPVVAIEVAMDGDEGIVGDVLHVPLGDTEAPYERPRPPKILRKNARKILIWPTAARSGAGRR
jgi:hypothetical protein